MKTNHQKRIYPPGEFYRLLQDLISSAGATRQLPKQERISKFFQERIMMTVTEVNGCRYCSYFHTRVALQAGMGKDEISRVLGGNFQDVPEDELAALYFAQHYAESGGRPKAEAVRYVREQYGLPRARVITAFIRAIMVGNAWGNMLDALRLRLIGKPSRQTSLGQEIGVIFGPLWMIPVVFIVRFINLKQ